jgi:hypothetical protein
LNGEPRAWPPAPALALGALAAGSAALLALLVPLVVMGAHASLPGAGQMPGWQAAGDAPTSGALADIPARYLRLYVAAARRYSLDWAVLAGVGKVECDHGRAPDPSCAREGSVNSAGAGGPAQFLGATWLRYGVDGDGDGVRDRWDAADAIYSMANCLHASGAPRDYRAALLAYNHAGWYVARVERWAAAYREAAARSAPVAADAAAAGLIPGARAVLSPADPHVALAPADVPAAVQAMVIAGNELQDLPYGAAGHPDPRGAPSEDCSSTVNYVLYRSGVRPIAEIVRRNPLAQDYLSWGDPGPGRWVSIYATTIPVDHVFMVIAGLRLDTSHDGTDFGPNRGEDGPRWRVLDHVPAWAHWTVRHPPGL